MSLRELVTRVIEDGVVDTEEVTEIRGVIYADTVIDTDEATALFEINNAVTGNDNAPEWDDLFVEALTDYVLQDEVSPGSVDSEEAAFLIDQIGADGQTDALETRLLENIQAKATSIDPALVEFISQQS